MKQPPKVRYITLSRVALGIIARCPPEDAALFIQIIYSCFQQLEEGQIPTYEETNNPMMDLALQEAVSEMQAGYETYQQRITARKSSTSSPVQSRSVITEPSAINHRSTIEENKKNIKEKEENRESKEGNAKGREFTPLEEHMLRITLGTACIQPDDSFWKLAKEAGYEATLSAIQQATEQKSRSLSFVVKLIEESMSKGI